MKAILSFIVAAATIYGVVVASSGTTPNQVHIALAGSDQHGNPNGMAISWNTADTTQSSTVRYGTRSGAYDAKAAGASSIYYRTSNHHVVLKDLLPSTKYYYSVGDDVGGWSAEHSFVSAPASTSDAPVSFAVFGDLGVTNGNMSIDFIGKVKDSINLVWHSGDVSYADDSFLHKGCYVKFCYEQVFDEYMNLVEPWASQLPYMTTPGNHEADCHDPACLADRERREKLSNFTAYNSRFRMPSPESGGVLNMHYSFNYGSVHFISLDTETGYPGAAEETRYILPCGGFGEQLQWLEKDLIQANANRDKQPWIFASGHHPMYQGDTINAEFQAAMEDLFYKYGVDVYFSGHVHSYERDLPVYKGIVDPNGYTNPKATTHILIGGAGNDEMHNAQSADKSNKVAPREALGKWRQAKVGATGAWTAKVDGDDHVGIGKVTIVDASQLKFEYYRTSSGEMFDSITLTRDHSVYKK